MFKIFFLQLTQPHYSSNTGNFRVQQIKVYLFFISDSVFMQVCVKKHLSRQMAKTWPDCKAGVTLHTAGLEHEREVMVDEWGTSENELSNSIVMVSVFGMGGLGNSVLFSQGCR